jgi:ribosomal protein S27E
MVLISIDSLSELVRLAIGERVRLQLTELCEEIFTLSSRGVRPASYSVFCAECRNTEQTLCRAREAIDVNSAKEMAELVAHPNAVEHLELCDMHGSFAGQMPRFVANFRSLQRLTIGTTSECYNSIEFRQSFPHLAVCVFQFLRKRNVALVYSSHHRECTSLLACATKFKQIVHRLYGFSGRLNLEYASAVISAHAIAIPATASAESKLLIERIDSLEIRRHETTSQLYEYNPVLSTHFDENSLRSEYGYVAAYLESFAKLGYCFAGLRELILGDVGHPRDDATFERLAPILFPNLTKLVIVYSEAHARIVSQTCRELVIMVHGQFMYVHAPNCEALTIHSNPDHVILSQRTKPKHVQMSSDVLTPAIIEKHARFATKVICHSVADGNCGTPNGIIRLPAVKYFAISTRARDLKFRLLAPALEELWIDASARRADEFPRGEIAVSQRHEN